MEFNKERDYIYQNLLRASSKIELEELASYIEDDMDYEVLQYPEIAKRRLLRSKYLSLDGYASAIEVIKLLLLHREYITMEQIGYLNLFSEQSGSASTMLSRLLKGNGPDKKSLLKCQVINPSVSQEKVYYLSPAAKKQLLDSELLPDKYLQDNMIDTSDKAPSLGSQLQHDVELLNSFYYLLANYDYMTFKWLSNIKVSKGDSPDAPLRNLISRQKPGVNENDAGGFRPDAVILSEDDTPHLSSLSVFFEQDMRTERESSLTEKLKEYADFYAGRSKEFLYREEIIFSVSVKGVGLTPMGGLIDNNVLPVDRINRVSKVKNEAEKYMKDTGLEDAAEIVASINEILKKNRKKRVDSIKRLNSITEVKKFVQAAVAFAPGQPLKDALSAYEQYKKEIAEQCKESQLGKISERQILKRMSVIQSAAFSNLNFKQMLLDGFSVHVIDSSRPFRLPYHLVQGFQSWEQLTSLVKKKYIKKSFKHSYEPVCTFKNGDRSFVLKNCIKGAPDDVPIVFENVSGDIGGELRVRTFLNEGFNAKVYLFLLVESELAAREFDQSFQASLDSSLSVRFRRAADLEPRGSLHIAYISYESEETLKNIFIIDRNGNAVQL